MILLFQVKYTRKKRVTDKQKEKYLPLYKNDDELNNNESSNDEETKKLKMFMKEIDKMKKQILMKKNQTLKLKR